MNVSANGSRKQIEMEKSEWAECDGNETHNRMANRKWTKEKQME